MAVKSTSVGLLIVGIVLMVVSLAADPLGIGAAPGMGWRQLAGTAVGVVLAVAGIATLRPART